MLAWFVLNETVCRILRDDPTKSDMHNRQGLDVKMIASVVADWRMWPVYALGIVHMGTLIHTSLIHANSLHGPFSPCHTSSNLPYTLAQTPRLQHDRCQPTQYPLHGSRRHYPAYGVLFQRDREQSRRCYDYSANLGPSSPHRPLYIQQLDLTVDVLRSRYVDHWFPIRAPDTGCLGFVEFL